MPLPRRKDDGGNGAPVLNILSAHVMLFDVEEHVDPYTVTRKSDGVQFTLDPGFKCTVEVVDDNRDGSDNGAKFFESFKYKKALRRPTVTKDGRLEPVFDEADAPWVNKENSKLGMLTNVVKPGYFSDDSIPELTTEDLEGFEMLCRIKPKKNPNTGQTIGSTIDWETMQPLPKKPVAATPTEADDPEGDFDKIPF
jgi:hypothetical protein